MADAAAPSVAVTLTNSQLSGGLHYHAGANAAADWRRDYLREVEREASILPWNVLSESFAAPENRPPSVAEIYTALDTTEVERVEREEDLRHFLAQIATARRVPIQEAAERWQRLLIMGDPGSGKSTFVKHLAYTLALAGREQPAALDALQPWSHGSLLPVFVELRQVAAFAADAKITVGDVRLFLGYLDHLLSQWKLDAAAQKALRQALQEGDCCAALLLDGLDEVGADQRALLIAMVNAIAGDRYLGKQRLIVTCRPYAYFDLPPDKRLHDFQQATLAPFTPAQVETFVDNWYRRLRENRVLAENDAGERQRDLKAALRRRDHRELAQRPILLTMMVQLHSFTGHLPDDRVKLYKGVVDLLLRRWNTHVPGHPTLLEWIDLPGLREDHLEAAFYDVAYRAHAAGPQPGDGAGGGDSGGDVSGADAAEQDERTANIAESELAAWLLPHLLQRGDKAALFVQFIRERAGLLIRHKTNAYTFPHRTIQEFLAACHLVGAQDYPMQAAALVKADHTRWREVFTLAAGYADRFVRSGDAILAINHLCPADCPAQAEEVDAGAWRLAQLAAEALDEIGAVSSQRTPTGAELHKRVRGWLRRCLEQAHTPPAAQRVRAGRFLARLGDNWPNVLDPGRMEFCFVAAGPFAMGAKDDPQAYPDEKPYVERFDVPYDYWIGRWPVTNAQYAVFMADGGYRDGELWPEAQAHNRWREDGSVFRWVYKGQDEQGKNKWDQEWAGAPAGFDDPFGLPNHPVVGVCWYELLAFSRWLERRLPAGWRCTLPNEPEWEKAARGGWQIPQKPVVRRLDELASPPPASLPNFLPNSLPNPQPNPLPNRRFPHRNQLDADSVNYAETKLGTTNPVGAFSAGASPYGVEELAGGVWEWTRSLWGTKGDAPDFEYPYRSDDGREKLMAGAEVGRILRGGSWYSNERTLGCGVRYWFIPYVRSGFIGGRVALLPPFSTSGL